jgi:hypothetical protein
MDEPRRTPKRSQLPLGQGREVPAAYPHAAACQPKGSDQQAQERRLARSTGPDDANELTRPDAERNVFERGELAVCSIIAKSSLSAVIIRDRLKLRSQRSAGISRNAC